MAKNAFRHKHLWRTLVVTQNVMRGKLHLRIGRKLQNETKRRSIIEGNRKLLIQEAIAENKKMLAESTIETESGWSEPGCI